MLGHTIERDDTRKVLTVTFEWSGFETQLASAIEIAKCEGTTACVRFVFNGRTFVVRHNTNHELMYRDFWLPFEVSGPIIGPYPNPNETDLHRQLKLERGSNFARVLVG